MEWGVRRPMNASFRRIRTTCFRGCCIVEQVPAGAWVQVQAVILPSGQRAPQVPEDTQQVPLVMLVKGYLAEPASLNSSAVVRTATGRMVEGTLVDAAPGYTHGFGGPVPELLRIGIELRDLLEKEARSDG